MPLYAADGAHPGLHGVYLAACVLLNRVTNLDPRDTTWHPAGISAADADRMRQWAWQAIDTSPIP